MRTKFTLFLIMAMTVSFNAQAAALPLNGEYLYHFAWNGLSLGAMQVDVREKEGRYTMRADVSATGLVKLFNKHISHTQVDGWVKDGIYQPQHYESLYQTKEKKKRAVMTFDADGNLIRELSLPRAVNSDRTPITDAEKKSAKDPLTTLLAGRALSATDATMPVRFKLYDGTRLAEATLTPGTTETLRIGNEAVTVSHRIAVRKAIGGYSPKELKKIKKGEPPLNLYFAKSGTALPLRIEVQLPLGTVTGFLVGECGRETECAPLSNWENNRKEWSSALGE